MKLSADDVYRYLRDEGEVCPFCRHTSLTKNNEPERISNQCYGLVKCNTCGAVWTDVYGLADILVSDPPSPTALLAAQGGD